MMSGDGKRRLVLPAPPAKKLLIKALVVDEEPPAATATEQPAQEWGGDDGQANSEEEDLPVLNDTEATLQLLKAQFEAKGGVPPFALKSQLYTVLKDRTLVDRQVDELRLCNALRIFKLPTGGDDIALMLTADYVAALQASRQQLQPSRGALVHVFDWFQDRVLPARCDVMLTHSELLQLLATESTRPSKPGSVVTDAHVALLLAQGFLNRCADGTDAYLFAMPGAGPAVRSIREGRAEIVQALQRRRYPEMPEKELEKRKLQRSVLGVRFHVRDMLGLGLLLRLDTTVGPVLRLAQQKK